MFYDGTKYIAIYGDLGGSGGMEYAESTNPSTGKWFNLQKLNFSGEPSGFAHWHTGIHYVNGVYHMVSYDQRKVLEYLVSSDGVNFDYVGNIMSVDGEGLASEWQNLYQSYPILVNGNWYLFVTGTAQHDNTSRRELAMYVGKDLMNLKPVKTGGINRKMSFNSSPVLNNSTGDEAVTDLIYSTYGNNYVSRQTGYGMMPVVSDLNARYRMPLWYSYGRKKPILNMSIETTRPNFPPYHIGLVWYDSNQEKTYLSTGTDSEKDWREFSFVDGVQSKTNKKDVTMSSSINVKDVYKVVLKIGTGTQITTITGSVDGQEIVLFNTTGSTITIVNGSIRTKSGDDTIMKHVTALSFIAIGSQWFEC